MAATSEEIRKETEKPRAIPLMIVLLDIFLPSMHKSPVAIFFILSSVLTFNYRAAGISFQGNFVTKLVRNLVQSYCVTAGQAFVRASGKNCCISAGTGAVNSMGMPETGCEKDSFQECRL